MQGFRDGVLVPEYNIEVEVDPYYPATQFDFNYMDIDKVVFSSYGGSAVDGFTYDLYHFVMDNFAINEPPANYENLPDLTATVRAFVSRKFGKIFNVVLKVENIGNGKADEFKVAMYLSDDEHYDPSDELLDERFVRRGLRANRSRNIRLKHRSGTSASGQNLICVVDSQQEELEVHEFNNVKTILVP